MVCFEDHGKSLVAVGMSRFTWSRLGVDVSIHSMSAYGAYARPRAMQDCGQAECYCVKGKREAGCNIRRRSQHIGGPCSMDATQRLHGVCKQGDPLPMLLLGRLRRDNKVLASVKDQDRVSQQ